MPTTTSASPCRPGKLDEAIAEYREAIRLKPDLRRGPQQPRHRPDDQGKLDEAIAEYREAIRLKPDYAEAHNNLGIALTRQGKLDEAIAEYRDGHPAQARLRRGPRQPRQRPARPGEAGRGDRRVPHGHPLKPDYAEAHNNLGIALHDQGKLDEADRRVPRPPSASSPTTPRPTTTSAMPCADQGRFWRGARRVPHAAIELQAG